MRPFITQFTRIFVGILFILSGLIKSNDPIGFGYKLEEYFTVFGTPVFVPLALALAIIICVVEVMLGIFLLIGHRVRLTLWLLLGMIVFFTFLTFYSAYFNKVTDCGCFGDALKLTPWQSFGKDVVLLVLILILFAGSRYLKPIFKNRLSLWSFLTLALVANIALPVFSLMYLPPIDFRPYKVGTNLLEAMKDGRPPVIDYKLLYKNLQTGKIEALDSPPYSDTISWEIDETKWEFVDQQQIIIDPGVQASVHDFSISNMDGQDYTDDILNDTGAKFFIVSYTLNKSHLKGMQSMNAFAQEAEKAGIPVYGLTADTRDSVEAYRHRHQIMFAFYGADATQLKTMIRANPGLILLQGATVKAMWPHRNMPNLQDVRNQFGF